MAEHEATFEIESKADAHAMERILTRLYDTLREESRTVREGTTGSVEMLDQFATVRDAARDLRPGTVTVIYEPNGESFEE